MSAYRYILTLDLDWAPDFMIEAAIEPLRRLGLPATLFVTHESPLVAELRRSPANSSWASTPTSCPVPVTDHRPKRSWTM